MDADLGAALDGLTFDPDNDSDEELGSTLARLEPPAAEHAELVNALDALSAQPNPADDETASEAGLTTTPGYAANHSADPDATTAIVAVEPEHVPSDDAIALSSSTSLLSRVEDMVHMSRTVSGRMPPYLISAPTPPCSSAACRLPGPGYFRLPPG